MKMKVGIGPGLILLVCMLPLLSGCSYTLSHWDGAAYHWQFWAWVIGVLLMIGGFMEKRKNAVIILGVVLTLFG
jgi:hypothetical protein